MATGNNVQENEPENKVKIWFLTHSDRQQAELVRALFLKAIRIDASRADVALGSHACAWTQYIALAAIVESGVRV